MNTQELLLNAAKAMGRKVLKAPDGTLRDCTGLDPAFNIFAAPIWNPLTNADKLNDMRAKLGICTDWYLTGQTTPHVICYGGDSRMTEEDIEDHPTRQAAEAMACLRVAASIGSSQGEKQ